MAKRSSRYKKPTKKDRGFPFYAKRYFLLLFAGAISFVISIGIFNASQIIPTCANSKSCSSDLSVKIENDAFGTFEGKKVKPPRIDLSAKYSNLSVLGTNSALGEKHIYVDLSTQTLVAYQSKTQFLKTFVSTGKWGKTPTGNFHIWEKLISTRMAGGEGAAAYNLPNVPYVMYFYHDFGLHGAYWHDNFGHTMSHGCVNMRQVDAKTLYNWADGPSGKTPGTEVSICDQIKNGNQCIQNNPIKQ